MKDILDLTLLSSATTSCHIEGENYQIVTGVGQETQEIPLRLCCSLRNYGSIQIKSED